MEAIYPSKITRAKDLNIILQNEQDQYCGSQSSNRYIVGCTKSYCITFEDSLLGGVASFLVVLLTLHDVVIDYVLVRVVCLNAKVAHSTQTAKGNLGKWRPNFNCKQGTI